MSCINAGALIFLRWTGTVCSEWLLLSLLWFPSPGLAAMDLCAAAASETGWSAEVDEEREQVAKVSGLEMAE